MSNRTTATPAGTARRSPTPAPASRTVDVKRETKQAPRRDLVETVWVMFCSVRFAVVLNVALALAILIGTLLPQMPAGIQRFAGEVTRFLDGAQGRYGDLSGILYWAGFYDLYNSLWF